MKTLLVASIYAFSPCAAFASSDSSAPISKIELTIADGFSEQPASITIERSSVGGQETEISAIVVKWRGSTVRIPKEELGGLPKLQIEPMQLRYGAYSDGRRYYYIDTFFGEHEDTARDGYKQVWLLMEGDELTERKTFITLQTGERSFHFKQLTSKPKGKPETKLK